MTSTQEINLKEEGDPPALYANNEKACRILNFEPKFSDLETIMAPLVNGMQLIQMDIKLYN